jgi:signal transduction histidine kinase
MRRAIKKRENIRLSASEVIDSIASGIAIGIETGGAGKNEIIGINNVTAESFNVSHSDLIGISIAKFAGLLGIDIQKDGVFEKSFTINTANNGLREVELKQGLLFDYIDMGRPQESEIRLVVYEFIDITEATRIKNSLIAAREQAISESELRNEMMAKLSHELKTPLNGLLGLSDILSHRLTDADNQTRNLLNALFQSANMMKDVVEYTLNSSALVDTVDKQNFSQINVAALLKEIVALVSPLADKKNVDIVLDCDNISIYAEPRGIRQIIVNVVENAIKYNHVGGSVAISAKLNEFSRAEVAVRDNGDGMTNDELVACTKPFKRFSNQNGSGLGLSIAENLSRNMGGQFEIQSKKGMGTTVTVNFCTDPV